MKPASRNMRLLKHNPACPDSMLGVGTMILSAIPWRLGTAAEQLMPFEKAAKAIFVKANGLPAYRKAFGVLRYSM